MHMFMYVARERSAWERGKEIRETIPLQSTGLGSRWKKKTEAIRR